MMIGTQFSFFSSDQVAFLRDKVLDILELQGVELDNHPEMLKALTASGANIDTTTNIVRFPRNLMEKFIDQAPRKIFHGARGKNKTFEVPRSDGTFHTRTGTGIHGWIDPDTGDYRKVTTADLAHWAHLVNQLDEITFMPFLFCDDVPVATADVHGLSTLFKTTDKHLWVQPYSQKSIDYLIKMGAAIAGGEAELKKNPVLSMIACSLTPRSFKNMDLEIILQSAKAGIPIHACSLPGSGGTAPATIPGVIILAAVEILAMLAMAQAVQPGAPVVACPIVFSTDMRSGRSLQSSVETFKGASGAVQFIKAAFGLPLHNYGSGSDSPIVDAQSMTERAMLSMLMGLSGLDILGGLGQLEVATAASPLQLIIDNEVVGMIRRLMKGLTLDDDHLALNVIAETKPGDHFMASDHTFSHCRDGHIPINFIRQDREQWEKSGSRDLMERVRENHARLSKADNPVLLDEDLSNEIDMLVKSADNQLTK